MHTGSENTGQTLNEDGTPTNADGALHLYKMLQQGKSREIKAEANRKICEFIVSLINTIMLSPGQTCSHSNSSRILSKHGLWLANFLCLRGKLTNNSLGLRSSYRNSNPSLMS